MSAPNVTSTPLTGAFELCHVDVDAHERVLSLPGGGLDAVWASGTGDAPVVLSVPPEHLQAARVLPPGAYLHGSKWKAG